MSTLLTERNFLIEVRVRLRFWTRHGVVKLFDSERVIKRRLRPSRKEYLMIG